VPTTSKPSRASTIFTWTARILVGALFLYTGITKILDHDTFLTEVRQYQMIPHDLTNLVAITVPWIEVVLAALLITGFWRCEARFLLLGMLVVFTAAKSYGHAMGWLQGCGCTSEESPIYFLFDRWNGVITNAVLIVLLIIEAYLTPRRRRAAQDSFNTEPSAPMDATAN